jgi:hypothetical protein
MHDLYTWIPSGPASYRMIHARYHPALTGTDWDQLGGNRSMSTAQPSPPGAFERVTTSAWRSVRRFLPKSVAEAIRVPARRALGRFGLIRKA